MDVLSEVLSSVRMTGAIFLAAEFTAPWAFAAPATLQAAPILAPGTESLVNFHLVTEGKARIQIENEQDVHVEAGEIVILPHGEAHVFCNGNPASSFDGAASLREHVAGQLSTLTWGGGGDTTRFVCGFFGCERLRHSYIAGLPTTIKLNIRDSPNGTWLENSIRFLVAETRQGQPGREILLSKMAEALFIEALRLYIATLPHDQIGWLAGARDPIVGAALALLHRRVSHPWTLDQLALDVGTSRSVLAERFTRYLGEPPQTYLARWRMQLAARKLQTTKDSVLTIALDVGYESEAAFNRAFKREYNLPPAQFRKSLSRTRH